jgi:hypothetical protein
MTKIMLMCTGNPCRSQMAEEVRNGCGSKKAALSPSFPHPMDLSCNGCFIIKDYTLGSIVILI